MTDTIETVNLKLLLFIRESITDEPSNKLQILFGIDKETAHMLKTISIDQVVSLSKVGFLLFSPRFDYNDLNNILGTSASDPKLLLSILNKKG